MFRVARYIQGLRHPTISCAAIEDSRFEKIQHQRFQEDLGMDMEGSGSESESQLWFFCVCCGMGDRPCEIRVPPRLPHLEKEPLILNPKTSKHLAAPPQSGLSPAAPPSGRGTHETHHEDRLLGTARIPTAPSDTELNRPPNPRRIDALLMSTPVSKHGRTECHHSKNQELTRFEPDSSLNPEL